jgi:hypothetical protein
MHSHFSFQPVESWTKWLERVLEEFRIAIVHFFGLLIGINGTILQTFLLASYVPWCDCSTSPSLVVWLLVVVAWWEATSDICDSIKVHRDEGARDWKLWRVHTSACTPGHVFSKFHVHSTHSFTTNTTGCACKYVDSACFLKISCARSFAKKIDRQKSSQITMRLF